MNAFAQNIAVNWAYNVNDNISFNKIVKDEVGNIYSIGSGYGEFDIDPGSDTLNISMWNGGFFIAKYDTNFKPLWVKIFRTKYFGISSAATIMNLSVDLKGNIYAVGIFDEEVDLDPSNNEYFLKPDNDGFDSFILKLDSLGNFVWAKRIDADYDVCLLNSLCADSKGNLYLSGETNNVVSFEEGNLNAEFTILSHKGFVVKYDSLGVYKWARFFNTVDNSPNPNSYYNTQIAIGKHDNIYLLSNYLNQTILDTFRLDATGRSAFLAKLDSLGNFIGVYDIRRNSDKDDQGISGFIQNLSLKISTKGNIFIGGYVNGHYSYNGNYLQSSNLYSSKHHSVFFIKINQNDEFKWVKFIENTSQSKSCRINDIDIDNDENLYSTGSFNGSINFAGIIYTSPQLNPNAIRSDAFIAKIDSAGNEKWFQHNTASRDVVGHSLLAANSNTVYSYGRYYLKVDFGSCAPKLEVPDYPQPSYNHYLLSIKQQTPLNTQNTFGNNIVLFPNPTTNGSMQVNLNGFYNNLTIAIYDNFGAQISKQVFNSTSCPTVSLPNSGFYFIEIISATGDRKVFQAVY